ncbi:hypothetical protein PMIN01_09021 [Paraphaeosphaeria minitans]|uniref:Uncharacterized protein n=1 Tax=Paraphaeosphaeria minitans TaxID=565426 RepID=A0A9P6GDK9_9PLEO|nr:hypothetical protein PMIN01_09021 [Paraphaeosphaeria minitans]
MSTKTKTKPTLHFHPTPFKPSYLSIPPSPSSPRTPLPLCKPPPPRILTFPTPSTPSPPPPAPLQWLWQCHQCHRTYSLGVTRRCLEDGHAFCSGGVTRPKTWRRPLRAVRVRRHRGCTSEFDYGGWKARGRWKRSGHGRWDGVCEDGRAGCPGAGVGVGVGKSVGASGDIVAAAAATTRLRKDCWRVCDYPSECRWGRQVGVHAADLDLDAVAAVPTVESLLPPLASDDMLALESGGEVTLGEREKMDLWGALDASAARRVSVASSSPLGSSTALGAETVDEVTARDGVGGVVVDTGDLGRVQRGSLVLVEPVLDLLEAGPVTVSSPLDTLGEMVRKGVERTRSSCELGEVEVEMEMEMAEKVGVESWAQALEELPRLERMGSRDGSYRSTYT